MKKALFILCLTLTIAQLQPASAAVAPAPSIQAAYPELIYYYQAPFDWSCQLVFVMNSETDQIVEIYAVNTATQQRTYFEHDIVIEPDGKSYSLYVDYTDDGRTVYTYGTISGSGSGDYGYSCVWSYVD